MKKLLPIWAATLAVITASLHAQTLNITDPDFTGTALFASSSGYVVTTIVSDGAGSLFYVECDASFGPLPTKIWSRSFNGTSAGTPALVHEFGSALYANFLLYHSGRLYFGETTFASTVTSDLYALDRDGSNFDLLGSAPGNYDAAFSGGSLFLSVYQGGGNKVSQYTLVPDGLGGEMLSPGTIVLDSGGQYSGPLEFGPAGELYYGSSSTGLFRYSALEVAAGGLTLDAGHRLLDNGANSYLASAPGLGLWRDVYSVYGTSTLSSLDLIDPNSGVTKPIGAVSALSSSLGALEFTENSLVAVVTDYGATTSSNVYSVKSAPEPTSAVFLLAAFSGLCLRRPLRLKR